MQLNDLDDFDKVIKRVHWKLYNKPEITMPEVDVISLLLIVTQLQRELRRILKNTPPKPRRW